MRTMVVMIGIQGSGKSEFYKQYLSVHYIRVNLDTLHTRNKERLMIDQCIANSESFAIDNTNPTVADRAKYITAAKTAGYHIIGYFMQSRLRDCIARNNLRAGKERIPATAIAATSNKLQMPSYNEGFDELYFVENDGEHYKISEWRE